MRARRLRATTMLTGCAAAIALVVSGCGLFDELPPVVTPQVPDGNVLINGGFESGADPWASPDAPDRQPFATAGDKTHSGAAALALDLDGDEAAEGTRVSGVTQPVSRTDFPEFLSGFYYVDRWQPGGVQPYIEFTINVRGGDFPDGLSTHELRFPLAGASRAPVELANTAKYVFLNRDPPKLGGWVYFSYPVHFAFETNWGRAPASWDALDVSFEVRYDGKVAGDAAASVRVLFDDLYLGQQVLDTNRPPDWDDD